MDFENTLRYVPNRTSLWCPMCGAKENQGCTEVKGLFSLRFASHNAIATGTVNRSVTIPAAWEAPVPKGPANRPKWTPERWTK